MANSKRTPLTVSTEQIPPSIVSRGFARDFNALAEHQVALGITDAELRMIQNYRRESWNPKAPPPSMRRLASKYGRSRGAIYALRASLISKGYAVAETQFAPDGSCLPSRLDFSPLWIKLAGLATPEETPLPEDPAGETAGPGVSSRPACPAACLPGQQDSPLTRGPATRRSPVDSYRIPVDPELPPPDKVFREHALSYGPRFKVKPGATRDLWRRLAEYAGDHALRPGELALLLALAVQEPRFLNPDGLWEGLEHFRSGLYRKVGAA